MTRYAFFLPTLLGSTLIACGGPQTPAPQATPDKSGSEAAGLEAAQNKHDKTFTALAASLSESCSIEPIVRIDWQTIDAAALKKHDVSARCGVLLDAMSKLCKADRAPETFAKIKQISCGFSDENHLELEGGTLDAFIIPGEADLAGKLEQRLKGLKEGKGPSLAVAKLDVCFKEPEKKQVIILAPSDSEHAGLSYGDGKRFFHHEQPRGLGVGWFFEPRYPSSARAKSFRGYDLRVYSKVSVDRDNRRCTLRCGKRDIPLALASLEEKAKIMEGAKFEAPPHQREAYALARDTRGTYYFIDRGRPEASRKDFRVYIGRRGRLKLQSMKDIVSDSEGEIFSTKKGKLRLVVGKAEASWIVGKKKRKLKFLPVEKNLSMIYNELGIYLGQRLGTPCDDL